MLGDLACECALLPLFHWQALDNLSLFDWTGVCHQMAVGHGFVVRWDQHRANLTLPIPQLWVSKRGVVEVVSCCGDALPQQGLGIEKWRKNGYREVKEKWVELTTGKYYTYSKRSKYKVIAAKCVSTHYSCAGVEYKEYKLNFVLVFFSWQIINFGFI